jgi:hypothetical protein
VGYFCRLFRTHLMGTPNSYRAQMLAGRTATPYSATNHHSFRGTSVPAGVEVPAEPRIAHAG